MNDGAVAGRRRPGGVLRLPEGTTHVEFGDLAHLIAAAIWPPLATDAADWDYGGARVELDDELQGAVEDRSLHVLDPLTFRTHPFPIGESLRTAAVDVEALRQWLQSTRGMEVVVGDASTAGPETPADRRRRRWARFKELGGEMRSAGEGWQTSGKRGALAELIREEANAGRPMSYKTDVRADLISAMEDQRES